MPFTISPFSRNENAQLKKLRRQQETSLAEVVHQKEELMRWVAEEKAKTLKWCEEQTQAATKERNAAAKLVRIETLALSTGMKTTHFVTQHVLLLIIGVFTGEGQPAEGSQWSSAHQVRTKDVKQTYLCLNTATQDKDLITLTVFNFIMTNVVQERESRDGGAAGHHREDESGPRSSGQKVEAGRSQVQFCFCANVPQCVRPHFLFCFSNNTDCTRLSRNTQRILRARRSRCVIIIFLGRN